MDPGCVPYRELPHTSRLFADYTNDFSRVSRFYPLPPQNVDGLSGPADYPSERRSQIAEILARQNQQWGTTAEMQSNLQRFRAGASAIVTGQQPVLFGGPAFMIYKALTAIKLAAELSKKGTDCVPIFWIASEDHDFAEVTQVTLRSASGELQRFALEPKSSGQSVGSLLLGEREARLASEAAKFLGSEIGEMLSQCYVSGRSLSDAFARLLTDLFGRFGLLLLDARDQELHRLAQPIYEATIRQSATLNSTLQERGRELEAAGYHQQVKINSSATLLFGTEQGARVAVRRSNGQFALGSARLQDYLLPTVAYIGGPAEVAYFAQAAVIYQNLLGRVTPIIPRFSATLLDARDQRLLSQHKLTLPQVWRNPDELRQLLAQHNLPAGLESGFAQAAKSVDGALSNLNDRLGALDPTLQEAAMRAGSKIRYQLSRLQARAARAEVRRNQELRHHAEALSSSLYPNQHLQEREIGGIFYVAQFGPRLLDQLLPAISPACMQHQVIPVN
jgi:uncharacterized protein YllA (UPF0747 family)